MIAELFEGLVSWYMEHISYASVAGLMAIESSFIPFPSEIIVPPAAWKAAQGEMNIWLVLLSSTLGALAGAAFNYYFALILGRRVVYRFAETRLASMMLIDPDGVRKSEEFFLKYGKISTFIGRLVPAVRQLISLPAGLARMSVPSFFFFTGLGAGLWNLVLAILGYFLWSQREILEKYYHIISYVCLGAGVLFFAYVAYRGITGGRRANRPSMDDAPLAGDDAPLAGGDEPAQ